jgi:hypothetical protein
MHFDWERKMPIKRVSACALVALILAGMTISAEGQHLQPFGPVEYVSDLQLGAPPDILFGNRPGPHEGYFFSYERLAWRVAMPETTPVGLPGPGVLVTDDGETEYIQRNGLETSILNANMAWGNRYELGYVVDEVGWMVGIIQGLDQNIITTPLPIRVEDNEDPQDGGLRGDGAPPTIEVFLPFIAVNFADPTGFLFLPVEDDEDPLLRASTTFDELSVTNKASLDTVEVMKIKRLHPTHRGFIIECLCGVRYLAFKDRFRVVGLGGTLADSTWLTIAENKVVGPQLGARVYHKRQRWMFNLEGRFLAGYLVYDGNQRGLIGSELEPGDPLAIGRPVEFHNTAHSSRFSPVGELRVDTKYQVTRGIQLRVGWTGLIAGHVSRASSIVRYQLPRMGLLSNTEELFVHGVNFGVQIDY